jgi:hypothetical protein
MVWCLKKREAYRFYSASLAMYECTFMNDGAHTIICLPIIRRGYGDDGDDMQPMVS